MLWRVAGWLFSAVLGYAPLFQSSVGGTFYFIPLYVFSAGSLLSLRSSHFQLRKFWHRISHRCMMECWANMNSLFRATRVVAELNKHWICEKFNVVFKLEFVKKFMFIIKMLMVKQWMKKIEHMLVHFKEISPRKIVCTSIISWEDKARANMTFQGGT